MHERGELKSMSKTPESAWQSLSQKKIYFGHQSVGDNIIDGINEVMKTNNSIKLNITKTTDPELFSRPVFAHSSIGKNDYPMSKIEAFHECMKKGIGDRADIAFFKFCFWDIRNNKDINEIFNKYRTILAALKTEYPKTKFVHLTVPLMSYQKGFGDKIKRMLNMSVESDLDNIKRNELNRLIRAEYSGREPIFDIAEVESTLPDSTRAIFTQDGKNYNCLASRYTNDRGHLNDEGKRVAAEQLLIFLANLSRKSI